MKHSVGIKDKLSKIQNFTGINNDLLVTLCHYTSGCGISKLASTANI